MIGFTITRRFERIPSFTVQWMVTFPFTVVTARDGSLHLVVELWQTGRGRSLCRPLQGIRGSGPLNPRGEAAWRVEAVGQGCLAWRC